MAANSNSIRDFLTPITGKCTGGNLENNIVQIFSILDDGAIYPCLSDLLRLVRAETRKASITIRDMLWDSGVELHQLLNAICDELRAYLLMYKGTSVNNAWFEFNCAFKKYRMNSRVHIIRYASVFGVELFDFT